MDNFFKLHTNCKITKGYSRSIIQDIQRQDFVFIPNSLVDVIEYLKEKKTINQVKEIFLNKENDTIDEYLLFLEDNEFGFFIGYEEFVLFPEMDTNFYESSHLTNAILEISQNNLIYFNKIINNLANIRCRNIQFIAYDFIDSKYLKEILSITKNYDFNSIELILEFSEEVMILINDIDSYNFGITEVFVHNSTKSNIKMKKTSFNVIFVEYKVNNFRHCGKIEKTNLNVNKEKILESLNHNSCLHKKISIDKDGYIRNCPSMPQHFGNIKDTTLEEALAHPDFKKYWNVNKDMIAVCKDCEFRHICTDCRAYTERTHFEGDLDLSKPLKCGYNPYTNEWAEWSTNPLKEKAIEYYGMQDLVKKDV
ncbi:MAG: grasp-with-spasm system SPASM domain peptide maturase [Flavobacterium sp.]